MKYTFIPLKFQFLCRLWEWPWYIHAMNVIAQPSILSPLTECVFIFLLFRAGYFPRSAMNPICPPRNQPACYSALLFFWCRKEGHLSLWVYASSGACTKALCAASSNRWNRVESISFCFNTVGNQTGIYWEMLGVFIFVLWPKNRRLRLFLCRSDTTWEELIAFQGH